MNLACARDETAALVEQHRRAVEHQLVLAAHQVHVEHGHRRIGGAGGEHGLALVDPTRVVRRRVDVHDELRAAGGLRHDGPGRAPGVLADRDADLRTGDHEQRTVDDRRGEVALLVEHRVVGEQVLAVHALHPPVRTHRGGVGEVALEPRGSPRPPPGDRCGPRTSRAPRHSARRTPGAGADPRVGSP